MKLKPILLTILVLGTLVLGYWGYDVLVKKRTIDVLELVPKSAVGIYKANGCVLCADSIGSRSFKLLLSNTFANRKNQDSSVLTIVLELAKKELLISLHKTSSSHFDFIHYFDLKTSEDVWSKLKAREELKGYKFSERVLSGKRIRELTKGSTTVGWVAIDEYGVLSMTPVLLEDVIRDFEGNEKYSLVNDFKNGSAFNSEGEVGDLHFNVNEFLAGLSIFWEVKKEPVRLGKSTLLDMKYEGNTLLLTGTTKLDTADHESILSFFQEQSPTPFELRSYVSNDAQYVLSLGISDGVALGERLQCFNLKENNDSLKLKHFLSEQKINSLYKSIGNEIVSFAVETPASKSAAVVLIHTKNATVWKNELASLAEKTKTDSVFNELYSTYTIGRIGASGLVGSLFPTLVNDFSTVYYTQIDDLFLLAEELSTLKLALEHIDLENTWGKSIEKNRLLDETLLESSVSFYIDPSKLDRVLHSGLNKEWKQFYTQNKKLIKSIGLSAVQFSHLNNSFYTHISISFSESAKSMPVSANEKDRLINVSNTIISRPFVVKNYVDRNFETLIQDSELNLYLISSEGKIVWQQKLDGKIEGDIEQIDFFKNGKLQYAIVTEKSFYILDRLGNTVAPFPIPLPFTTDYFRIVDYDHSKNYRFLLADKSGVLRMLSTTGDFLEGWESLNLGNRLEAEPRHHRVAGKDIITVLQKNGLFSLYNRRGEVQKNFPIDLNGRAANDYFLKTESKDEHPHFVFVLADGFRLKLDTKANEISRETLVKPTLDSHFRLVKEEKEKAYVIVRQDNRELAILNDDLEVVVTNEFIGHNNCIVDYYDLGSDNIFYTVTDTEQDLAYVYNGDGKLLNTQPFECQGIALSWQRNSLQAAITYGSTLQLITLE